MPDYDASGMTVPVRMTFHHVGVGTTRFDDAITTYEMLGYRLTTSVDDTGLGVKVAFLAHPESGSPWIEILAPLGEKNPLQSLISRGSIPSPYHTCYSVSDIAAAEPELKRAGFVRITKPAPAAAFEGALVAFFYSNAVGILELVEQP